MANYPKELEDLIQEYLTDGIITEKERRVLLNKAQVLGLNVDEVDLYIDAQQQKLDQRLEKERNESLAKFNGRTCPYCETSIPALADKCPNCGAATTVKAEKELEDIIDHLEEALVDFKSGKDFARNKANVERYVRKAKMYYGNNPKIKTLLEEINAETENAEKKAKIEAKKEFVKSHPFLTAFIIILIICFFVWIFSDGTIAFCTGFVGLLGLAIAFQANRE